MIKITKYIILAFVLIFQHDVLFSQNVDSLLNLRFKNIHDTEKVKLYYSISEICDENDINKNIDSLFKYLEKSKPNLNPAKSFYYLYKTKGLINRAYYFNSKGNIAEAIKFYFEALKIAEKYNFFDSQSAIYNNMSLIYKKLNYYDKAIAFIKKSIQIRVLQKEHNPEGLAIAYGNLAALYYEKKDSINGNVYDDKAIELNLQSKNPVALALAYIKIADKEKRLNNFIKAKEYYYKALELHKMLGDNSLICIDYINLSEIEFDLKNIKRAYKFSNDAANIARQYNFPDLLITALAINTEQALYINDYKVAYHNQHQSILIKDSLRNNQLKKLAIETNLQHEFDKKQNERELIQQENLLKEKQKRDKIKWLLIMFIAISVIVLISAILIYKRWKLTKLQNNIIEKQHALLESKNQSINDSINYASSIQNSFLIPRGKVNEHTGREIMLMFKPKDIVSGDFYWFKTIGEKLFVIVADCTGHGVPGAFISLICLKAIETTVEFLGEKTSPNDILNRLDSELQKVTNNNTKAGVDLVIACLYQNTNKLIAVGSRNAVYITRNNKIEEYKFKNRFIGQAEKIETENEFYEIDLMSGDELFFTSDGFADQKGGENKSKFYLKPFRELLLKISPLTVKNQRIALETEFETWKGNNPQTDDVLVVGIKI